MDTYARQEDVEAIGRHLEREGDANAGNLCRLAAKAIAHERERAERAEAALQECRRQKVPRCADCNGTGKRLRSRDRWIYCESCDGRGY